MANDHQLDKLKKKLDAWLPDRESLKRELSGMERGLRKDYEKLMKEFERAQTKAERQLDSLKGEGETRFEDLKSRWFSSYEAVVVSGQRIVDALENIPAAMQRDERQRYFLGPKDGRWQLRKAGAKRPLKIFSDKREAMDFSRDFARARKPSQLVIRRRDGTFEVSHSYGNLVPNDPVKSAEQPNSPL